MRKLRYRVYDNGGEVELFLSKGYGQHGDEGRETTHVFWVPQGGGYVREVTRDRPGTLGRQVCESLFGFGSTLEATPSNLADKIRRLARLHCDRMDRESIL